MADLKGPKSTTCSRQTEVFSSLARRAAYWRTWCESAVKSRGTRMRRLGRVVVGGLCAVVPERFVVFIVLSIVCRRCRFVRALDLFGGARYD